MSSLPSINVKAQDVFTQSQANTSLRMNLLENGYPPLPLAGKKCHLRDWPSISITDQLIDQWEEGNTGIRCDNLLVIDIDVSDDNAAAAVSGAIQQRFGQTIVRRGKKGCALFFRCGAPTKKVKIEGCSEGTKASVELLGDAGHYIAAFGNHPATGQPYRYDDARFGGTGQSPLDVPASDLPEISEDQIPDLLALIRDTLEGRGCSTKRVLETAAKPQAQGGYTSRRDGKAATAAACKRVRSAQEGERNETVVRAAFDLGGHVGAGTLDREEAKENLLEAAIEAGLPAKEALDTISSGMRAGIEKPYALVSVETQSTAPVIYTAAELMEEELPPMQWVIPGILPEGLTVLAGKPKKGKSWLALQICLSVADGVDHVGLGVPDQGEVLYLALEDSKLRLQERMTKLGKREGSPILKCANQWKRFDSGGFEELDHHLKDHPRTRVVFIDTFAKVKPAQKRGASVYEEDYKYWSMLKKLADNHHVAIVAVHHQRKLPADDPLDSISGSTGLTGAADSILLLFRKENCNSARLVVTGRDVRERELNLFWCPDLCRWSVQAQGEKDRTLTPEREAILDVLEGGPKRVAEVAQVLGKNANPVKQLMHKMRNQGILTSDNGVYETAK